MSIIFYTPDAYTSANIREKERHASKRTCQFIQNAQHISSARCPSKSTHIKHSPIVFHGDHAAQIPQPTTSSAHGNTQKPTLLEPPYMIATARRYERHAYSPRYAIFQWIPSITRCSPKPPKDRSRSPLYSTCRTRYLYVNYYSETVRAYRQDLTTVYQIPQGSK